MPQIRYALRDDEKTIAFLVQGCTAACPLGQIITLRKRETMPEFLDQYLALDVKGSSLPATALTEAGREINLDRKYRSCLVKIHSQIEFTVKPRTLQRLSEFMPAYNPAFLLRYFEGQPSGFITVLQVFETSTEIPDYYMEKGRLGSAQIIQLYDEYDCTTSVYVPQPIAPIIEAGTFAYIREEIIYTLRLENSLIGIYENDENSKRLLREKRNLYNDSNGNYKKSFNEDAEIDYSSTDYEEIYSRIIEKDPSLRYYIDYIKGIKPPQMVEWQMLRERILEGDEKARVRTVEMYMRNVLRVALLYSDQFDIPVADVIQDGLIGLNISIDKFEQADSTSFPNYFPMWVRQTIQRKLPHYLHDKYIPVHVYEQLSFIRQLSETYNIFLPPDEEELQVILPLTCKALDVSEEKALQLLSCFNICESLDELMEKQLDEENEDVVTPEIVSDAEIVVDKVMERALHDAIFGCLDTLTPKERKVICIRYGLTGGEPKTLAEVGAVFGVTRERIRQIEMKALRKLAHRSRAKKLEDFY